MNINEFKAALKTLTALEVEALKSAYESSDSNGHDFGFTDDIVIAGQSKQAVGGVISSLIKKGILDRDVAFGQFGFLTLGDEDERNEAADAVKEFIG